VWKAVDMLHRISVVRVPFVSVVRCGSGMDSVIVD
jgi:hypothetical protein